MPEATQKTITPQEAAYFAGLEYSRFRNLIKRGDFNDIGQVVPSLYGKKVQVIIKPAAFMARYGITWEDVFEARKHLQEKAEQKEVS